LDTPTTHLQTLGRAFLDALLARLGHHGAAAVLLLLAAEIHTAEQRHRELLRNCAAQTRIARPLRLRSSAIRAGIS
jgi:hypothetical protein